MGFDVRTNKANVFDNALWTGKSSFIVELLDTKRL